MAEPRIEIGGSVPDVEMEENGAQQAEPEPLNASAEDTKAPEEVSGSNEAEQGAEAVALSQQNSFLNYLKSPIVELVVGKDDERTTLTAHQAVLTASPYFSDLITQFDSSKPRLIRMENENVDTVACLLQFQYTGEYFPKRLPSPSDGLETDPAIPDVDDSGEQLLKHARVYTLAEKLGLVNLKQLAHGKIHRIDSTAQGEISYARYVYGSTAADDTTIRKPVAAFWATRSHVLRHEAEQSFRSLCLEHPQFGFDVLNLVLDQKEKRVKERDAGSPAVKGSARKRARVL